MLPCYIYMLMPVRDLESLELLFVQLRVDASESDKVLMGTSFNYSARLDHHDLISREDGRQPVGDQY